MNTKSLLQKLNLILLRRKSFNKVNWFKTLILNFTLLPWKQAMHFPILIYGKLTISSCWGNIHFLNQPHRGSLKIGITDPVRSDYSTSYFSLNGDLFIGDNVTLRRGLRLEIDKSATLTLDSNVYIGDNCTIICKHNIHIKSATRVGNDTTFMDSDFHYIINTKTRTVNNNTSPIEIGKNNWIGGHCIIKKGAKTPSGTILAGPFSMIGKDYNNIISENCIIAGCPAKLITENMRRINNTRSDISIVNHFKKNSQPFYLETSDLDEFCLPSQ